MCKLKHNICLITVFTLLFLSIFCLQIVKATGEPLLLLDYTEIDSEHFVVNIKLCDLPNSSVIAVPISYSSSVAVCGYDYGTGEITDITDGVLTKEVFETGKSGIKIHEAVTSTDKWGGRLLINDFSPYINNEKGVLAFTVFSMRQNNALSGENNAFSICFKRLNFGAPNIKIATKYNSDNYDAVTPDGAVAVKGANEIKLKWLYTGDVFDHTPDPVAPPEEETETDDKNQSNTGAVTGAGSGSSSGSGSSGGGSVKGDSVDEDKNSSVNTDTENTETDKKTEKTEEVTENVIKTVFSDLKDNHWAYEYIYGLNKKGVINGYEDLTFRPENNITRAEIAKIVVNVKGIAEDKSETVFTDSNKNLWYDGYLTSAYKNNLILGYPNGTFEPENNITREDLCTILYRLFFEGKEASLEELAFSDSSKISDYAVNAVKIFSEMGIINGRSENKFAPQEFAERAEVAKVVYLCMQAAEVID